MTTTDDDYDNNLLNDTENSQRADEAAKWSEKLLEKYEALRTTVSNNFPNLWTALEFALSVKTILNIRDCTLPFAGILLGPPSSLKTVVIELLKGHTNTFHTHNFSPKSFVSHNSAVKKEKLQEIDMLPKIKNKLFLTPELAPIFSSSDEDLLLMLGILTSVLDGHGFESDSGAQGHRGYNEDIMFTWLGAVVDIPFKVHKQLSVLGPKLYFFRLPKVEHDEDHYYNQKDDNFGNKVQEVRQSLNEYLEYFDTNPRIAFEYENELPKIPLDHTKDEEFAHRYIIRLGKLLAPLRAVVPVWETKDSQGSEYNYEIAIVEDPSRAITQLRNLARAHALSKARNYIKVEDIPMVIHVVLSTCSISRARIFELLIENKGILRTSQIVNFLNTTNPTARRTMTELKATSLVDMYDSGDNSEKEIRLRIKGNHITAIEYFDKAIELDPNYILAWNNKGTALRNLGRNNDAKKCYDKVEQLRKSGFDIEV
jgi:tetratricopeptide (TPR) repeat protein